MTTMEETITQAIIRRYFEKLSAHVCLDVAIVGAGPSGLVAARGSPPRANASPCSSGIWRQAAAFGAAAC